MPSSDLPSSFAALAIADAEPQHLDEIQAIYSHYVLHDLCSFEEQVPTVAQMLSRRLEVLRLGLPYPVSYTHLTLPTKRIV